MSQERVLHARAAKPGRQLPELKKVRAFRKAHGISPEQGKKPGDYSTLITQLHENMVHSGRVEKGNAGLARTALTQIADSMSQFPIIGNKRKALCCIVEICLAYSDPIRMLEMFRSSYTLICEIAEVIQAGRKLPVGQGRREEAERFAQDLRRFTSIMGLREIRRNAVEGMNGSHSTYEIPFVTRQQLDQIARSDLKSNWRPDW
ncbi:MAG: hypothetical protein AB1657_01595 [Candidatus Micrarchaeota archaeon]